MTSRVRHIQERFLKQAPAPAGEAFKGEHWLLHRYFQNPPATTALVMDAASRYRQAAAAAVVLGANTGGSTGKQDELKPHFARASDDYAV